MNNTSAPSNGPSNASSSSSSMFGQPQQQQQQYQQQQQQPQQQQQYGYGANVQQWQQPQAQPQQQQQLPPQQQQQQGQQPNFFSNDLAAAAIAAAAGGKLSNDALMNAIGQRFLENSSARMVPGLEYTMNLLRLYFAVDNHYVKRKILKVLFPFLSKQWERMVSYLVTRYGSILSYSFLMRLSSTVFLLFHSVWCSYQSTFLCIPLPL